MPEYVVSTAGDDNAVGTAAAPFRTIKRGIQKLSGPGDVLVIRGGIYPERMDLISTLTTATMVLATVRTRCPDQGHTSSCGSAFP
jgi:hypothetical protein